MELPNTESTGSSKVDSFDMKIWKKREIILVVEWLLAAVFTKTYTFFYSYGPYFYFPAKEATKNLKYALALCQKKGLDIF